MPLPNEIILEPIRVPQLLWKMPSFLCKLLELPSWGKKLLLLKIFPWFPVIYKVPSPQPGLQGPHSELSLPVGTKVGWEQCSRLKRETQQRKEGSDGG